MRILLIHGRGQGGKDPDALKASWMDVLKMGFASANRSFPHDTEVNLPYFGDRLDQYSAQANLPTSDDVISKGPGQNRQFEEFMKSALIEIKDRGMIGDAEVTAAMMHGKAGEKGPQNWGWVQAIARAIDKRLGSVADFAIEAFLRDVYLYVRNAQVKKGINVIIEENLTPEPTVVIGHSLGSVIGYCVLRDNLPRINLVKYVTVGCPLGIRAISSKLGIPENPSSRNGWYNAYDERDIVSLNPLNDEFFPTNPAIVNNGMVRNQTDNRHGIIGYLNDSDVAIQIADALG